MSTNGVLKKISILTALEKARVFIGGLSAYDNKLLPKSTYEEARGVLFAIAEAQKASSAPPAKVAKPAGEVPTHLVGAFPDEAQGISHEDGECRTRGCCCRETYMVGPHMKADHDLWMKYRHLFIIGKNLPGAPRPFYGQAIRLYWQDLPKHQAISDMLGRLAAR